eukprot:TRINITY_DN7460_c0_g1_i3.p1 TRINITY_DN7460_c0_g1~~TRINITY_DN7460_c0_g1_i3.p1  ORF type:complete len:136 (+),score=30.56 TRINITY_DN7460_c0_g1_i3:110-517(+)
MTSSSRCCRTLRRWRGWRRRNRERSCRYATLHIVYVYHTPQDMLTAHAKEHGLDLRQILTPSQYKDIFGDKDAAEEVEEEEEEDVDTEAEEWKDKIREFIKTHKPSMSEKKVNALFSRYAGKEEQLYDDLVTKYA